MSKVLFVSHIANFSKFNIPYMKWFKEQGWDVYYASMGEEEVQDCDGHYTVPFNRLPWSSDNIKAYKVMKEILKKERFDIIHCHTPMGSIITRLSARKARKNGTKIIYTAHGFHFYKGAPLVNWIIYYTAEKIMARYTDCLVTINEEDYQRAIKSKFKAKSIERIDGVGVDISRFRPADSKKQKNDIREKIGLKESDFVILCTAEFIKRKNQKFLIACMKKLWPLIPTCKLVLVGKGELLEKCKLEVQNSEYKDKVLFYGYRRDVERFCMAADILVSASYQEGLPINVIEGMASGLPVVCTSIRGQNELIDDGKGGFKYEVDNYDEYSSCILNLQEKSIREKMSRYNMDKVNKYSLENAINNMGIIYKRYM